MTAPVDFAEARRVVAEAVLSLFEKGLVALSSGNVSARVAGTDFLAITPSGKTYDTLVPEDIVIVDGHGVVHDGALEPSSEVSMHSLVYAELPGINAIVHTHSPYATAFSVLREPIPLVCNEGFGVMALRVDVSRYELPGSPEIGRAALEALSRQDGVSAVLLANHGLLATGATLADACRVAENVELEARIYHLARSVGQPTTLTQDQLDAALERYYNVPPKREPELG